MSNVAGFILFKLLFTAAEVKKVRREVCLLVIYMVNNVHGDLNLGTTS